MKKTTKNTDNFHSVISEMATNFTNNVLSELGRMVVERMGQIVPVGNHPRVAVLDLATERPIPAPRTARGGRLPRRSQKDIDRALERVATVLAARKEPLRAEQIRVELKLPAKAMPRVLKQGLSTGVLRSKGQKRATTYELVSASAAPHPAKKPAKVAGKGKKA